MDLVVDRRRTAALARCMTSQALNRGANTKQVPGGGNWKTSAMVDRYVKLSGESLRETAALLADLAEAGLRREVNAK